MRLILASASPRRQELLRAAAIDFTVDAADLPEVPLPGETRVAFAERMARQKARVVFQKHAATGDYVLGADTDVCVDGQILGKPENAEDAARMLRLLSGRVHEVTTGVCLIGNGHRPQKSAQPSTDHPTSFEDVCSETTRVWVDQLSEEEVREYVASGEPMDKAGAYAIQGIASRWISRIEGCYFNVVGLPVPLVYRMLRERGAISFPAAVRRHGPQT